MERFSGERDKNGSAPTHTYVNVDFRFRNAHDATISSNSEVYRALYDYEATCDEELSLRCGDKVELVSKSASISGTEGWWTGRQGDTYGIFPANYVELCRPDSMCLSTSSFKDITSIKFEDLELKEMIGHGGFGCVKRGN